MVANLEWDPQRRAEVWGLLTTGQTSSFPPTTLVVVSTGGQKVLRMDANPVAEAFLGCMGGEQPGSKGRGLSIR